MFAHSQRIKNVPSKVLSWVPNPSQLVDLSNVIALDDVATMHLQLSSICRPLDSPFVHVQFT